MLTKNDDLILGALSGQQYKRAYPGVESYIESIKRSGFTGRKVILVWNIHPQTRADLTTAGFEIIDADPWPSDPFFHARMRLAWEHLKEHSKEFRFVFWLDIKDLILQSDPSIWMEENKGESKIIGSTECVTIEQEETNRLWAQSILGMEKYEEIKDCEVINGGTWAGESEAMTEVFHQVHLGCKDYAGGYPPCQININYVLHKTFQKELYIPRWSEGFAACLHPCWSPWRVHCYPNMRDPHPALHLETCVLYPGTKFNPENKVIEFNNSSDHTRPWFPGKKLRFISATSCLQGIECIPEPKNESFCIVHGPDRDWNLRRMFEYKYRFDGDFDWEKYRVEDEASHKNDESKFRRPLRNPMEGATVSTPSAPDRFKRKL